LVRRISSSPNGAPWVTCELNESYRLTPAIASFLNAHYRLPSDTPVVGVNVRARQIAPEYVHGDAARGDLVTLITEQLAEYAPQGIMVLAPSVRSPDYRCRHAAHTLSEQQGIALHTTHRRLVEVNPELLAGKLVISTFHQSKGDERKCVIVLGSDARLHARRGFPLKDGVAVVDNGNPEPGSLDMTVLNDIYANPAGKTPEEASPVEAGVEHAEECSELQSEPVKTGLSEP